MKNKKESHIYIYIYREREREIDNTFLLLMKDKINNGI